MFGAAISYTSELRDLTNRITFRFDFRMCLSSFSSTCAPGERAMSGAVGTGKNVGGKRVGFAIEGYLVQAFGFRKSVNRDLPDEISLRKRNRVSFELGNQADVLPTPFFMPETLQIGPHGSPKKTRGVLAPPQPHTGQSEEWRKN